MNKIYYEKPKHLQKKGQSRKDAFDAENNRYGQSEELYTVHNEIENQYFQPSYQAQDYTTSGQMGIKTHGIKELIANGVMVVLSIALVINVCIAFYVIGDMNYSWVKDEDNFWYDINSGNYASLVESTWINRFSDKKQTDGLEQCYAVAEYFEAASLYKVAEYKGNIEEQEKYAKIMEEKLAYFDDIMYIAEDINEKLGIE